MAWTNIFDFCDWDVYVKCNTAAEYLSPDSEINLVKLQDLDPSNWTTSIVEGVITLTSTENLSGSGGDQPRLVVVPKGSHPGGLVRITANVGSDSVDHIDAYEAGSIASEGAGIYSENTPPEPSSTGEFDESWDGDTVTLTSASPLAANASITCAIVRMGK